MKPLVVLLAAVGLLVGGACLLNGRANYVLAGNGALAAVLVFTGLGHFALTQGMTLMLPEWLPFRRGLVLATGVLEIVAAMGLLWAPARPVAAWGLAFFVAAVLANVHAARACLDYQTGRLSRPGPGYRWFRVPLRLLFLA